MFHLFPQSLVYDPFITTPCPHSHDEINKCDVTFVCVPTNQLEDGSCDTSIVEETVGWLETPLIIIRSTVKPGTTHCLLMRFPEKHIVFMPEYIGETVAHPLINENERTFLIFGGVREDCVQAYRVFQSVYNSSVRVMFMETVEAELVKYMENTAIGTMVTLCNEFYNICQALGVDYEVVREGFLLDPRMSRYFTFVYPDNRGFSGKCLPKDLNAICESSKSFGYDPEFIRAVLKNNDRIRNA